MLVAHVPRRGARRSQRDLCRGIDDQVRPWLPKGAPMTLESVRSNDPADYVTQLREILLYLPLPRPRRGPSQSVGAAALSGGAHVEGTRAVADARSAVARAVAHAAEGRESAHGN